MEIDPSNPAEVNVVVERFPDGNVEIRLYQDLEEAEKRIERESKHEFKEVHHERYRLPGHYCDVTREEMIAAMEEE